MAAPVISAASSILGYRREEEFEFQPAATNAPVAWGAVGLPSGVEINSSTGLISGACSTAGVYVVTVSATNGDEETGSREFVLGISSEVAAAAEAGTALDAIVLEIELPGCVARVAGSGQTTAGSGEETGLFSLKEGDTRLVVVRYVNAAGVRLDPDVDLLRLSLKELEPDGVILQASEFEKVGEGETAEFLLLVEVGGAEIEGVWGNYEEDLATGYLALGEFEWTREVSFNESAVVLRSSTPTFRVRLDRDLGDNELDNES